MQIQTIVYTRTGGWNPSPPPALDSERTLIIAFGAPEWLADPRPFAELTAVYPRSHMCGCSTSGEIFGTSILDGTISAAVIRFDATDVCIASARVSGPAESAAAGEAIASHLYRSDLRAVLVLSDGIHVNGSDLLRGINAILPPEVIVTGGLAGDGDRFRQTWVLKDGRPQSGFVSAIGFFGDRVGVSHGSRGGWDIFGPERRVTRSQGNILFELDGKPALALYKKYLGERAAGLPATALLFPLALRTGDDDKTLVRTILAVDEVEQSLTFAGDVPQGALAQLMRANFDRLIDGAQQAALLTRERSQNEGNSLAIAISCVGRRLVLGERTEEEVEAAKQALPAGAQLIGFYSYGEISPYATGRCDLHNQTMTLTNIWER